MLLLDEPDNYLDIPTRVWLEDKLNQCPSTILMVSHDRSLLERCATTMLAEWRTHMLDRTLCPTHMASGDVRACWFGAARCGVALPCAGTATSRWSVVPACECDICAHRMGCVELQDVTR